MSEEKWKESSLQLLKTYYFGFVGTQWHEFDISTETKFLKIKIAYALFGLPTDDAEKIEDAYNSEQRERAKGILDLILKVYKDSPVSKLRVGFIIVSCKQNENEFSLPVFSVYVGKGSRGQDLRKFVDTHGRTYQDWEDWKKNNCLPKLQYAYPKFGYFTCSPDGSYEFDAEKDPIIEYGLSPQSSIGSEILTATDIATSVVSIGSGVIGIAALFTPLAPVVVTAAAIAGTSSAVYGAGRGISTLVDKGTHGQSLGDLESLTIWFGLAATPFHFVSSAVNGTLAIGAQQGRIFSNSMRMFATVVNFTTLGLDSVLFGFGLANLINKAVNKELTTLDVLQFSISTFFFTNTLIQPKLASSVIRRAQQMHFDKVASSMSDKSTKQAFEKFLEQNKSGGTITERSKIVRTINRMDDPGKFFKSAGPEADVMIGGRKGKTVLISDRHGHTQRVRPNNYSAMFTTQPNTPGVYKFNRDYNRLKKCYGTNPEDVELNGVKIFENLDDQQKGAISRTVGGTARSNQELVLTAHNIAENMGCKTSEELMSIIELVAKEVEGKSGADLLNSLGNLKSVQGSKTFIRGVLNDIAMAKECASKGGLNFDNPLTAVYHYRKHGADFPEFFKKSGNTLKVYVGPVKNELFQASNLRETCRLQDGTVRHIYTMKDDKFGVVTSTPNGAKVSTMYRKPNIEGNYHKQLAAYFADLEHHPPPEPVSDISQRLARFMGFRAFHVIVSIDGKEIPIEKCHDLDPRVHEQIAEYLNALISC